MYNLKVEEIFWLINVKMIRQYRAFEDLEEPCYLVPEPEWITITYQMKSIICQWRWDEIKELKAKKLSPTKKKYPSSNSESVKDLTHSQTIIKPYSNSVPASPNLRILNSHYHHSKDPEKIIKKNLLRIEFLKRSELKDQPKFKWYRFDTRDILDEFLSDANRNGYIERLVISRWFSTKIKYQPKCLIERKTSNKINNNNEESNKKKLNRFLSNSNSSSASSSSLEFPEFIHNHKKSQKKSQSKIFT